MKIIDILKIVFGIYKREKTTQSLSLKELKNKSVIECIAFAIKKVEDSGMISAYGDNRQANCASIDDMESAEIDVALEYAMNNAQRDRCNLLEARRRLSEFFETIESLSPESQIDHDGMILLLRTIYIECLKVY